MTEEEKKMDLHGGLLYTYDCSYSIEECIKAINCWKNEYGYNIDYAWIDKYIGDKKVAVIKVGYAPIGYASEEEFADTSQ